jgi:hypothetical protein
MWSWLSRSNAGWRSASRTHSRFASSPLAMPWMDTMASLAWPERVGLRLEPDLPLRFQRAGGQGLQRPVGDHRDSHAAALPVALPHIHLQAADPS